LVVFINSINNLANCFRSMSVSLEIMSRCLIILVPQSSRDKTIISLVAKEEITKNKPNP